MDVQYQIASMTKLCTAYTCCRILEELGLLDTKSMKNIYMQTTLTATQVGGTSAYIQNNERITIYDCLCGMMLPSGNDAAIVLATEFGRWLYLTTDKNKMNNLPILSNKGKFGIYQNDSKSNEEAMQMSFLRPMKGHTDYLQAFNAEMNRQC